MPATDHRFKPERTNGGAYFCDCSCGWSGGVCRDRWSAQVMHDAHAHGLPGPTDHLKVQPILLLGDPNQADQIEASS